MLLPLRSGFVHRFTSRIESLANCFAGSTYCITWSIMQRCLQTQQRLKQTSHFLLWKCSHLIIWSTGNRLILEKWQWQPGADLGCVAGGVMVERRRREGRGAFGAEGVPPPQKIFWFLSWKWRILVHSGCYFSAQLRLLLYLQKMGHYWTAKTSCSWT